MACLQAKAATKERCEVLTLEVQPLISQASGTLQITEYTNEHVRPNVVQSSHWGMSKVAATHFDAFSF